MFEINIFKRIQRSIERGELHKLYLLTAVSKK